MAAMAPVRVIRTWPLEGGNLKHIGLNVKEMGTQDGNVSFVKFENNCEWLPTAARGIADKGALRMWSLFNTHTLTEAFRCSIRALVINLDT